MRDVVICIPTFRRPRSLARLLERSYKGFIRSGAKLGPEDKKRLAAINERLAGLGTQFSQNVLKDESSYALFIADQAGLAGLPEFLKAAMARAAADRGKPGQHAVTLSRSIIEPFLTFSTRRDLREEAFIAWQAATAGRPCDYTGLSYRRLHDVGGIQWPCNSDAPDGTERLYCVFNMSPKAAIVPIPEGFSLAESGAPGIVAEPVNDALSLAPFSAYIGILH